MLYTKYTKSHAQRRFALASANIVTFVSRPESMGWVGLEPTTNALKGRCSTIELPTLKLQNSFPRFTQPRTNPENFRGCSTIELPTREMDTKIIAEIDLCKEF
jgi:hypothetical protein